MYLQQLFVLYTRRVINKCAIITEVGIAQLSVTYKNIGKLCFRQNLGPRNYWVTTKQALEIIDLRSTKFSKILILQ